MNVCTPSLNEWHTRKMKTMRTKMRTLFSCLFRISLWPRWPLPCFEASPFVDEEWCMMEVARERNVVLDSDLVSVEEGLLKL